MSSSIKRLLGGTNTSASKKVKNESTSNNDETTENATTKPLVWNDQWLTFPQTPTLEEFKIDSRSSLKWCPNFFSEEEGNALFEHLMTELNFERSETKIYGKNVTLPRLQSWFAEEGLVVKELFQKQKQHAWTSPMLNLKAELENLLNVHFDYCLVNLYRNGQDYIGYHADNETKGTIASVSLGATRRFLLRHLSWFGKNATRQNLPLTIPEEKEYEFSLKNGSLIVMLGETQNHWKHSVPKQMKVTRPRINLTFRTVQAEKN